MASNEDWLLRPVQANMIRYESLLDGTINLGDIADLNDCLETIQENEFRVNEAMKE